ncbi:hypothetical protein EDD18DRAFT_1112566 [Armillaria luteobubalina]|uniref:Ubiquitin-like protease family profile domain-containing protein n=1 Tax=Armillaria luteobubalina TaxID=153913 RepID=A0AA39TE23_9AGAR|nr:hypothetical protein EDD18DRAFT_1112566 [Armillaria luteobubalina]
MSFQRLNMSKQQIWKQSKYLWFPETSNVVIGAVSKLRLVCEQLARKNEGFMNNVYFSVFFWYPKLQNTILPEETSVEDSSSHAHWDDIKSLALFLASEALHKKSIRVLKKHIPIGLHANVSRQQNLYNCGVFMLHFAETFLSNPHIYMQNMDITELLKIWLTWMSMHKNDMDKGNEGSESDIEVVDNPPWGQKHKRMSVEILDDWDDSETQGDD